MRRIEYWITYIDSDYYEADTQEKCFDKFDTYEAAEEHILTLDWVSHKYLFIRKVFVK